MIHGLLKMMVFWGSLSIEVWIEIHGCDSMGLVVLKETVDDLEWGGNHMQKQFFELGTTD